MTWRFLSLKTVAIALFLSALPAQAVPSEITYMGRLVNTAGKPLDGTVSISIAFYREAEDGDALADKSFQFASTKLASGVFTVSIKLTDAERAAIFDGGDVYVEVTDDTNGKTYQRQKYSAAPYAFRVPTDDTSVTFNAKGKLAVGTVPTLKIKASDSATVTLKASETSADGVTFTLPTAVEAGKFLTIDADGQMGWAAPAGSGDITGVTAGTGLTGGATSGTATLNVDVGTAAGKIVQVQTGGKLPALSGADVTALDADELASGTIPDARFPATLPAANGSALTALNGTQITSGTIPAARLPATLPASDGSALTDLNATQLTSGTVPDARFPATLPAASGVNLTALNASALGSGTIPDARFPATLPAASGANLTSLSSSALTGALPAIDGSALTGISTNWAVPGAIGATTANTAEFTTIGSSFTDTNSSGVTTGIAIEPTYNQTGTAGATDLIINRTETALGSGTHNLIDAQVGGTSKFTVSNSGATTHTTTNTASSGTPAFVSITPTYNQTATAGGTDLLINRTQTAVGSGTHRLIDAQVGGTSKFFVTNEGDFSVNSMPQGRNSAYFFDDFQNGNISATAAGGNGETNWTNTFATATATIIASPIGNRPGVLQFGTAGVTAGNFVTFTKGLIATPGSVKIDADSGTIVIEAGVNFTAAPSVNTAVNFYIGLGNSVAAAIYTNGIFFNCTLNTASASCVGTNMLASTPTSTGATTVAYGAASSAANWHRFTITITNNTSTNFAIDGTSLGNVAGLPTAVVAPAMKFAVTNTMVGARPVNIDYYSFEQTFATRR